jgi:hypothetical protein
MCAKRKNWREEMGLLIEKEQDKIITTLQEQNLFSAVLEVEMQHETNEWLLQGLML